MDRAGYAVAAFGLAGIMAGGYYFSTAGAILTCGIMGLVIGAIGWALMETDWSMKSINANNLFGRLHETGVAFGQHI